MKKSFLATVLATGLVFGPTQQMQAITATEALQIVAFLSNMALGELPTQLKQQIGSVWQQFQVAKNEIESLKAQFNSMTREAQEKAVAQILEAIAKPFDSSAKLLSFLDSSALDPLLKILEKIPGAQEKLQVVNKATGEAVSLSFFLEDSVKQLNEFVDQFQAIIPMVKQSMSEKGEAIKSLADTFKQQLSDQKSQLQLLADQVTNVEVKQKLEEIMQQINQDIQEQATGALEEAKPAFSF